jgi:putative membrane protein insertion efficiency factor
MGVSLGPSAAPSEPPRLSDAADAPRTGVVARALIVLIRVYQLLISPWFGPVCRFHPSCSRYTSECLRLHGSLRGSYLGLRRILRCHPFNPGGYDPPPLPRPHG